MKRSFTQHLKRIGFPLIIFVLVGILSLRLYNKSYYHSINNSVKNHNYNDNSLTDSVSQCIKATSKILRPKTTKYLMGSDIIDGKYIAKIWFENKKDLEDYKLQRRAAGQDSDLSIVKLNNGKLVTVYIVFGIEKSCENKPVILGN